MNHASAELTLSQKIAVGVLLLLCTAGLWCYLEIPRPVQITVLGNGHIQHQSVDYQGRPHGIEKQYFPTGKLASEVVYDHGEQMQTRAYWPNGRLRIESREGPNYSRIYSSEPREIDAPPASE